VPFDLVLTDLKLKDGSGLDIIRLCRELYPETLLLVMTAYATAETAVEAMKLGALDYLCKPFNVEEVKVVIKKTLSTGDILLENRVLKQALKKRPEELVFQSPAMSRLVKTVERIAKTDTTILVTGESGTGKEVIMKLIHQQSHRASGPFIPINCGALPEHLLESELFGHEKGAFTGAEKTHKGLLEAAAGGTVFFDEIGELPLSMQVKLLRALQERTIRRVGGHQEIPIDVRVLAATNRSLEADVRQGQFREDLYYRVNVVPLQVPPLRERREDIPLLMTHFLELFCLSVGERVKRLQPEAMRAMEQYDWPGNVRELKNTIERLVALTPEDEIGCDFLPANMVSQRERGGTQLEIDLPEQGMDLEAYLNGLRQSYIEESLRRTNGHQTKAAELLGMTFRSFRYYYKKGEE
jgi:two-component system response regulator PilR (NtrC family)